MNDDNLPETSGTESITADMQWCWKDSLQPDGTSDNVKGNVLMDLWYYDGSSNAVVIDLLFDRVWNDNGSWEQDNSQTVGDTYSTPHKTIEGGITVYHYSVVVRNTDTNADTLYSFSTNVDDYIDDAFDHNYPGTDPAARSDFDLVSVECGFEITNAGSSDGGEFAGEIFKCDARY